MGREPAPAKESALCALHIAAWSQVGVLVRIYLDKFFTNGCTGGWGVCLLSQGGTRHGFGAYFPDLASNMLGSFVMGALIASSTFGLPSAKAVAALPLGHPWQDAPELFVGLRTGFCGSLTTFASWQFALLLALVGGRGRQGGQWAEFLWGQVVGLQLAISSYAFGGHLAGVLDRWLWRAADGVKAGEPPAERGPRRYRLSRKTNVATAALLAALTGLWVALAVVDSEPRHAARRQQWFALLLGPFGALLRWKLVTLHGRLPGWRWFPAGTFAANLAACCIDYALQAAQQRASLGYWPLLMFGAIRVGFSGALSTVSTFVAEVHKALAEWPERLHAYSYALLTLAAGTLSGVVIYGWSLWA